MAGLSPLNDAQMDALLLTTFAAELDPKYGSVNLGKGSPMAALLKAMRQLALVLQGQVKTVADFDRLENATGPDVASFVKPWGFTPGGGTFATTTLLIGTNSAVQAPLDVKPGMIVQRKDNGAQYVMLADPAQPNFALGVYTIPLNGNAVPATFQCLEEGSVGNMPAGTALVVYGGAGNLAPASISVVTAPTDVTNGIDEESGDQLKQRFQIEGGFAKWAVRAGILGAIAKVQPGLVYQYGDHINPDGTYHGAWFSIIVNSANSPTGPTPGLLAAVKAAVDAKRAGGIEFDVYAPVLVPVTVTGVITPTPGFVPSDVDLAVKTAVAAYINAIGLNVDGSPTLLSFQKLGAMILGIPGVSNLTGLLMNGAGVDIAAPFAHQLVASGGGFTQ